MMGVANLPEAKLAREAEMFYATVRHGHQEFGAARAKAGRGDGEGYYRGGSTGAGNAMALVARLARGLPVRARALPALGAVRSTRLSSTAPKARDKKLLRKPDAVAGRVLGKPSKSPQAV